MTGPPRLEKGGPARVLVLLDQPLLAEVVALTLNHGVYHTRNVPTLQDARSLLKAWQPHVAVLDMDIGGSQFVEEARGPNGPGIPVLALTRRGDLQTKLAA